MGSMRSARWPRRGLTTASLGLLLAACGPGSVDQTGVAGSTTAASEPDEVTPKAPVPGATDAVSPIYRFAKLSNGAYFYTGDPNERDVILASNPDFRYEGVAFQRSAGSTPSQPVYRFANLWTGGYFYTASEAERESVLQNYPHFRFEGSSFAVAPADAPDASAVYRLANLNNGAYLYTTSLSERDAAVGLGFWRDEGLSFYVPNGTGLPPPTNPVYRTPTWLAGGARSNLFFADPERPGTTAQTLTADDAFYVPTHRVHAETRLNADHHIAYLLLRRGDHFVRVNMSKAAGALNSTQVSSENAASNSCNGSGYGGNYGNRLFSDLADPADSTYFYHRRDIGGVCRLLMIRVGMAASAAPLVVTDALPISALYAANGAINGYLAFQLGNIVRMDRDFGNPQSIGALGWNPSTIQNQLPAFVAEAQSQNSSGYPFFSTGSNHQVYGSTAGWMGPTGKSFVVFGAAARSVEPDRLFVYDDNARTLRQVSQTGTSADFDGAPRNSISHAVGYDGNFIYWTGGGGVWRYALNFTGEPEQIAIDPNARQPVMTTATHAIYHRAEGTNSSAHLVSVPKVGGAPIVLETVDTPGGRLLAVATTADTVYFNGSRDTSGTSPAVYSGRIRADGAGGREASFFSHWVGWTNRFAWTNGESTVDRLLLVDQVPNSTPTATTVNLRLSSVSTSDPTAQFQLLTWSHPINQLRFLGQNYIAPATLPILSPRALLRASLTSSSSLDLYLIDTAVPGTAVRKTSSGQVLP